MEEELTLSEFLSSDFSFYHDISYSDAEFESDQELLSLTEFLSQSSDVISTRHSSMTSDGRDVIGTPRSPSCTSINSENGLLTPCPTSMLKPPSRLCLESNYKHSSLEKIANSDVCNEEENSEKFTFWEILSNPDIMKSHIDPDVNSNHSKTDKDSMCSSNNEHDSISLGSQSSETKNSRLKKKRSLRNSNDSRNSSTKPKSKIDKKGSTSDIDSEECTWLEFLTSEMPNEDDEKFNLMEFLAYPVENTIPTSSYINRSTSLQSLQNFVKHPIYKPKKAKSDEDLLREYSLVEFLSAPIYNPSPPNKFSLFSFSKPSISLSRSLKHNNSFNASNFSLDLYDSKWFNEEISLTEMLSLPNTQVYPSISGTV